LLDTVTADCAGMRVRQGEEGVIDHLCDFLSFFVARN
jgi:hypothetical protein